MNFLKSFLILLFFTQEFFSQTVNLNQTYIQDEIRNFQILNKTKNNLSLLIRPIKLDSEIDSLFNLNLSNQDKIFTLLPLDFLNEYNSNLPYNRNNGIMIPNRGLQTVISPGIYLDMNFLEIQIKPEFLFSENLNFDGFWDGHYPIIISKRQNYWNHIDTPERFGEKAYSEFSIGQSYVKLNFKNISFGLSNENLWWGPSIRNSIMLSNNAIGFNHLSLNTNSPISTPLGNFEFQLITGKLIKSGFAQSFNEFEYAGHLTYVKKNDDWRYFQGLNIVYSPKFIDGLSIGFIRWVQAYSTFIRNNKDYFPVFDNLLRNKDKYGYNTGTLEALRDQAAGINFRWIWKDSKAEIYAEFYRNDSAANLRDLFLDSDHSRAATIGLQKIFNGKKNSFLKFFWEWTQLEQSNSKFFRNWGSDVSIIVGSWYHHDAIMHGFTNRGEVLGASIGPGSNSHYFGLSHHNNDRTIGLSFEIIDQNNDFLYYAFYNARDFRRYWKDFNLHFKLRKKIKKFWFDLNAVYSRSLNYQWALDESTTAEGYEYYVPGIDKNNFHINLNIFIPLKF